MNNETNPNPVPTPAGQPDQSQAAASMPPAYAQVSAVPPTVTPAPTQPVAYTDAQAPLTAGKPAIKNAYVIVAVAVAAVLVIFGAVYIGVASYKKDNSAVNSASNNSTVSDAGNNSSAAATVHRYMQAIYEGDCEQAWSAWDSSSPYVSTKSNHDIDCESSDVIDIAMYVYNHPSDYITSDTESGLTDVTYSLKPDYEEPFDITVTVKNGKIYQIKM
ncbi:hypothetical protein JNM87_01595 [Candidatus Saccharibacteria bacterium]|nr:hypothetical protein [Candidatus Saccharibacteria bacterium]